MTRSNILNCPIHPIVSNHQANSTVNKLESSLATMENSNPKALLWPFKSKSQLD
jgi:hypothetical protein